MSTANHVVAAVGQMRSAWVWLKEATIPGPTRRHQRLLGDTAKRELDRQAAAERADRHSLLVSKRVPTGPTPAPTSVSAVDARAQIAEDLDALAWQVASHLRANQNQRTYRPHGETADTAVKAALDFISACAVDVASFDLLTEMFERLIKDVDLAHATAGAAPQRRPLAAECPACGRRSLAWDTSSPQYREWSVSCTSRRCSCAGRECSCRLPDRRPHMSHVWLEASWEQLATQLNAREAG